MVEGRGIALFEIHPFDGNESMPEHVDRGLRLLENDVAKQRLVRSVLGRHVEEDDLVVDRTEPFDLNFDRATDLSANRFLRRRFQVDRRHRLQPPEALAPGAGEDHVRGARVHLSVAADTLSRITRVVDFHGSDDATHDRLEVSCQQSVKRVYRRASLKMGPGQRGGGDTMSSAPVHPRYDERRPGWYWLENETADLEEVLRNALALDVQDRASLAERLLASLDQLSEAEADRLWADEAERRLKEYRAGRARSVPADEVHRRAQKLLG